MPQQQFPSGLLSPQIEQYLSQQQRRQRQEKFFGLLTQMGRGLVAANRQGGSAVQGLSAGLAQGHGTHGGGLLGGQGDDMGGLLEMLKLQEYMQEQKQAQAGEMLSSRRLGEAFHKGGKMEEFTPPRGGEPISPDLMPGRSLLAREEQGLLGLAAPDIALEARAAEIYPKSGDLTFEQRMELKRTGPERRPTERQQKTTELKTRGFSQSQAEDIASGRVRVSTDPNSGAVRLVNIATGRMTQPRGQSDLPKKVRAEMAGQVQSIDGLLIKMPSLQKAIEKGVGFIPAAKEFGGKVLGQLPTGSMNIPGIGEIGTGEKAVHPEIIMARTALRIFREDAIAAFRKSGKVPVQEQTRILEFIDKLGVLNSAPDAKLAFQQLETELRRIRDTYDAQLGGQAPALTDEPSSTSNNPYSNMSDQEVLELLKQQGYDIGQ